MPTPGQTVGPFFGFALPFPGDRDLVPPGHPDAVRLTAGSSTVTATRCPTRCSRSGRPTPPGASSAAGGSLHRDGYTFTGWGRAATDVTGRYTFTTLLPGRRDGRPRSSR